MLDDNIRKNLEDTFDIPFVVYTTNEGREPVFWLAPEDPGKELFTIRISFRNKIRMTMDFIPQKYSVSFVQSMGEKKLENKVIFSQYYELMRKKGAKGVIKINGIPVESNNVSSWPVLWKSFEAHITRMPIVEDGDLEYSEVVCEWGALMMGMILTLADIVPVEDEIEKKGYKEGNVRRVESDRYERNPLNRKLCLAVKGYDCSICGFNFTDTYGELGHNFIHVHHITPVSKMGPGYLVNPVNDLIPVCPNCHAMLHKCDPPIQPIQLKNVIIERKRKSFYYDFSSNVSLAADSNADYGMNNNDNDDLE